MPATDDLIFIELEFQQSADEIIMRLNEPSYGDLRTPFAQPFPEDVLSSRLEAIERRELSRAELSAFGQQLYQALEETRVGEVIRDAIRKARRSQRKVILQLRFDEQSVELASLPWELLHDKRRPLLAAGLVDLVRYIAYPEPVVSLGVTPPLRVLQVIASPADKSAIDVEKARAALDKLPSLVVDRLSRATYDDLLERLEREPRLHVFHFDGHSTLQDGQNVLCFEGEDGNSDPVDAEALHIALYNQVSLVVLNACLSSQMTGASVFSSLAPALIEAGIPAVVGMQFSLSDDAAARFVETFYSAVARFEPLTRALTYARKRLWREDAWYIPTLYLRSQDKTGQLFCKVEEAAGDEREEPEPRPVALHEFDFPSRLVESFPYPVAVLCDEFNRTDREEVRFQRLDALFCNSVKYLASIALAQYRQENPDQEKLRLWLRELSSRHLSSWVKLLDEITERYRENTEARSLVISKLLDAYDRPVADDIAIARAQAWLAAATGEQKGEVEISPRAFIRQLTAHRQQTWEAGTAHLDEDFYKMFLPIVQPALRQFLELMTLITDYPLRYAERAHQRPGEWIYDMYDFCGPRPEPTVGEAFSVSAEDEEPPHKPFRLYLCTPNGEPLLNLHPLLICLHSRLYFLEAYGEDELLCYRPCYGGGLFEPPDHLRLSLITCLEPEEQPEEETASVQLGRIENQIEELEKTRPVDHSLSDLLNQLAPEGRQALEIALGEALRIGHFWLGVEFLLMALSKQDGRPFSDLLHELGMSRGHFRGALRGMVGVVTKDDWRRADVAKLGAQALDGLQPANPVTLAASFLANEEHPPVVTPRMMQVLRDAANLAGEGQIGHGHLLLAALQQPQCLAVNLLLGQAVQAGWDPREVLVWVAQQTNVEPPDEAQEAEPLPGRPPVRPVRPDGVRPPPLKARGVLAKYGRDLTAEARAGRLHPAIGVDALLRRLKRILIQREANNPLLVGEAGVGKTAIVEGLAYELVHGDPGLPELADRRIVELSINSLVAGTKYRGELEERVEQIIAEVKVAPDVIVFIDEIHTVLGGGGDSVTNLANALKPALARGEFPCIGATTIAEYRKYVEKDRALSRRFETVLVEEPGISDCIKILEGLKAGFEEHYGVRIVEGAIEAAVRLSARYLPDERLPVKAIKLLEQAGPYVKLPSFDGRAEEGQQEQRPLFTEVNEDLIRYLVAKKTGIPLARLTDDEREWLKQMEAILTGDPGKIVVEEGKTEEDKEQERQIVKALIARQKVRVIGQDEAVHEVVSVIKRAKAGLQDPNRPLGIFLFVGPTGVGKTELARALADFLFYDRAALIRLDMSEYMEKHQVSRLIGAPPGYVGYEEEGQLTGQLRLRPYSVVLLDEIEKAHEEVHNIFLQLFDEGRLTDARGRTVDGREAIFIMTSNVGSEIYVQEPLGFLPKEKLSPEWLREKRESVDKALRVKFKPEFLNRVDRVIHFNPLTLPDLTRIFQLQFESVTKRLLDRHQVHLTIASKAIDYVCEEGYDALNGARPLARAIDRLIVDPLTDLILTGKIKANDTISIGYSGLQLTFEKHTATGGSQ